MKLWGPGSKEIKNYRMEITELQCWAPGTPLRSGCLLQSQPCWGRRNAKKPAPTCSHTSMHTRSETHVHICTHAYMYPDTCLHLHTSSRVYMHAYTCTSIRYCPFTGMVTGLAWLCPLLCITDCNLAGSAFMSSPYAEI